MNRAVAVTIIAVGLVAIGSILYVETFSSRSTGSSSASIPTSGRLSFIGNSTVVFTNVSNGTYRYTEFPSTNFTFDNFVFTYLTGNCLNVTTGVQILPCGSRLSARFPSYGIQSIPIEAPAGSLHRQDDFQWTSISVNVVDGKMETVGLVLIIHGGGERVVYVYTP